MKQTSRQTARGRHDGSISDKSSGINEIFIVDDDYDMREALSSILRDADFAPPPLPMAARLFGLRAVKLPLVSCSISCMPGLIGSRSTQRDRRQELSGAYPYDLRAGGRFERRPGDAQRRVRLSGKRLDPMPSCPRLRGYRRLEAVSRARRIAVAGFAFDIRGYYQLTRREREVLGADRHRGLQQGDREKSRHQPADRGDPSRPDHAQARREEFRRSDAYCHEQRPA